MNYLDTEDGILPLSPQGDEENQGMSEQLDWVQKEPSVSDLQKKDSDEGDLSSKNYKFETGLKELEGIVQKFEDDGGLDLEASLVLYEKGIRLVRKCHQTLKQAEQRVVDLKNKMEFNVGDTDHSGEDQVGNFDF